MEKKSHPLISRNFLILFCSLLSLGTFAQVGSNPPLGGDTIYIPQHEDSLLVFSYVKHGRVLQATMIDGDTVPWIVLNDILLISEPTFNDEVARKRYFFLKRKVMKVYPYAVIAGNKLDSLNLRLDTLNSRRARNRYIKEYHEYLEERFEPELRKLTHSEGQILCKLLYRETGVTVYDLITDYRSGWTAFWYNVTANWYEISLKQEYDPKNNEEDKLIENILQRSFSQGLLVERVPFYPPNGENGEVNN